jgi:glyoxylase-like metal-dependent hydrolase (beta-lactamase superfamily II)
MAIGSFKLTEHSVALQLGEHKLTFLNAGRFKLDGGAMFSVVPKVIWEKTNPADEFNCIEMAANSLLIEVGDRKILVETGNGDKIDEKFRRWYDIERTSVVAALRAAGLEPAAITDVVNTHLHFDHAGGNTFLDRGVARPSFPNASYHIQVVEWECANDPTPRDRGSYLRDDFVPLEQAGRLKLLDGEAVIGPGVRCLPTPGHNLGHQTILIETTAGTACYCTDLCPTTTHLNLPFIMSYDLYPVMILETKQRLLDRAVRENWLMCFYHDPVVHYGYIGYNAKGRAELKPGWR